MSTFSVVIEPIPLFAKSWQRVLFNMDPYVQLLDEWAGAGVGTGGGTVVIEGVGTGGGTVVIECVGAGVGDG